jgi:hypothetical protein
MTTADAHPRSTATPVAVQILTVIFYAGFAISVSIVAMAMFGLIGVALALFLAWQWARIAAFGPRDTGTPAQHRAAAPPRRAPPETLPSTVTATRRSPGSRPNRPSSPPFSTGSARPATPGSSRTSSRGAAPTGPDPPAT